MVKSQQNRIELVTLRVLNQVVASRLLPLTLEHSDLLTVAARVPPLTLLEPCLTLAPNLQQPITLLTVAWEVVRHRSSRHRHHPQMPRKSPRVEDSLPTGFLRFLVSTNQRASQQKSVEGFLHL